MKATSRFANSRKLPDADIEGVAAITSQHLRDKLHDDTLRKIVAAYERQAGIKEHVIAPRRLLSPRKQARLRALAMVPAKRRFSG
jgi:hypothetical protein